jgi:pyruvate-formate lyase-activating enzyme
VRVLLVHANPFQRVTPVPPYGLERIRAAAEPTGAEVEIIDPYLVSEEPIETAVRAAERLRPDVIGLGVRIVDDCIVVDRLDGADDRPFDVTWFLPEQRRLRRALGRAAPDALFVCGGAAFSTMPLEVLEYLEVEYGVVGAGEAAFRRLVERVRDGRPLDGIPGLVRRGDTAAKGVTVRVKAVPARREPLYAPSNSFPVRTRIGCAMQCAYCLTANLQRAHANGDVAAVVAEIEATIDACAERGVAETPIFFADDEFNLPDERHAIAVLRAIRERGLHEKLSWRGYFNPTPFSEELARLVAETNGHVSITVDTAAEPVMARARKPFRRRHLDALIDLLGRQGVPADVGLIFGLPGETEETIAETVGWVRSLPPSIEVVYSAGARVYPHTPLAAIARAEPERLVGAQDPTFLEPVVYSSPLPPRELARRLHGELSDLPNVSRVGVGFGSGRTTLAEAYRAVLRGADKADWARILERAAAPGDFQRAPAESVASCLDVALWHQRFDLAGAACSRLLKSRELPERLTRRRLRLSRLAYGALAVCDRLSRRRRSTSAPDFNAASGLPQRSAIGSAT